MLDVQYGRLRAVLLRLSLDGTAAFRANCRSLALLGMTILKGDS
jgi:hypothetical protein